MGYPTVFGL